jgi:uncharacterized protein (TIGR03067 family)
MAKPIQAFLFVCAVLSLALTSATGQDKKPPVPPDEKKDAQGVEGTFMIVSGELNGMPVPGDKYKGSVVVFTKDKVMGTDKDKKEFFASTYAIDRTKTPWAIKMTSTSPKPGMDAPGLIEVKDDTVRIIYALPGGEPPTEFKTKDKQHMFSLKRVKEKKEG